MTTEFTVAIVGDAGVGKTTFLNRHLTGNFTQKYDPTMAPEFESCILNFNTNHGAIRFVMLDTAGQEKFDANLPNVDAIILMFDTTNVISYKNISNWYVDLPKTVPMVLCGNKVDLAVRKVGPRMINFHRENNMPYYDISAKSNYNFEKPFLRLARELTGHDDLAFTEQ